MRISDGSSDVCSSDLVGMSMAFLQVEVFPLGAAWNWPLSIACGLALGALVGLWQGLWVAYGGVPAFVVTLGGLLIFRGAAFEITEGPPVAPPPPKTRRASLRDRVCQ